MGREQRYREDLVWRRAKPLKPQFMGDLFTICTGHWLLNSPHRSILGHSEEEERSRAITSSNSNLRPARHANRRRVHTHTHTNSDRLGSTFAQYFPKSCRASSLLGPDRQWHTVISETLIQCQILNPVVWSRLTNAGAPPQWGGRLRLLPSEEDSKWGLCKVEGLISQNEETRKKIYHTNKIHLKVVLHQSGV